MIDTKELRRLAQAATPGPWHATKSVETNSWAVWSDTTRLMELRPTKTVDMYRVSNTAAFIAAANPAAISELIDRLEAAEKERDAATKCADMLALALNTSNHERDALRAEIEALRAEVGALRQNAASVQPELVAVALAACDAVDDLIEKWYATRESGCLPTQVVRAMGASKLLRAIALEAL